MLSTNLSAKVDFIDHFLLYILFCFYLLFHYFLDLMLMHILSQYRFQYHLTGTGVYLRWYWSFTYVVLECYLCGTGKELICINQAFQLMCSS